MKSTDVRNECWESGVNTKQEILGVKEYLEMSNKKILALDMDGTILDDHGQLTDEVIYSIQTAKKIGCIVAFVTGRREIDIYPIRERCAHADYLLLDNGAVLIDVRSNEKIFHKKPDLETSRMIVEWCLNKDFLLYVIAGLKLAVNRITEGVKEYVASIETEPHIYSSWQELPTHEIDGLMVTDEGASISEFLISHGLPLYSRRSEPNCIDLILEGTGKWEALKFLAAKLQVEQKYIIAVGNYTNDIEMIMEAGIGVAVANALDEVKEAADYVLKSDNNGNPVREIIERILKRPYR